MNSPDLAGFSAESSQPLPSSLIESDLWQAGFDMTWEIDVFGGNRRAIESANYSVQAAMWDRRDVLVSMLAEVAVNYIELRVAAGIAACQGQSSKPTADLGIDPAQSRGRPGALSGRGATRSAGGHDGRDRTDV